jgi:cytochrome b561
MSTDMNSHTFLAKTIHWTFSILYAYGIFKQVDDLDELEDPALLNFEIIFAVAFLIFVFIRYFYMKDTKTLLGAHYEVHKGHLFIAKATHRIVYFSLIMLPTTGLLIAGVFNSGIPGMRIAIALHEFAAFLSYITIGIHVAASLYSRFKGEGIWNAMVPVWQESKKNDSKIVSTLETIEQKVYNVIQERLLK